MNSKNSNEMFFVQFFNYKIIQSISKQQGLVNRLKKHGETKTDTRHFRSMFCRRRWNNLAFPSPFLFNPLGNSRDNNIKIE